MNLSPLKQEVGECLSTVSQWTSTGSVSGEVGHRN